MSDLVRYRQYKFKFYLNASHSIYIDGLFGQRHPHTWEISIQILKMRDEFIAFDSLEKEIESFLDKYQNKYLNDLEPFNSLNPTLENVCKYLRNEFRKLLNRQSWLLLLIEVAETPTRSYIINLISDDNTDSLNDIEMQRKDCLEFEKKEKQQAEEIAEGIIKDILGYK
jgi:6-pyruvoyltetrahydropterin/6-carboxytetrahydropterin synthase